MAQKTVEDWRVIFDTVQNATKTTEYYKLNCQLSRQYPMHTY